MDLLNKKDQAICVVVAGLANSLYLLFPHCLTNLVSAFAFRITGVGLTMVFILIFSVLKIYSGRHLNLL